MSTAPSAFPTAASVCSAASIGGRSGNRGRCAQPCRLPLCTPGSQRQKIQEGYLLSPTDLCYLPALSELKAAGVTSLKIEGRMEAARVYGHSIRSTEKPWTTLQRANLCLGMRSRFRSSTAASPPGYLFQNPGPKLKSYQRPNNRGVPVGRVKEYRKKQALISLERPLRVGDGIEVWVSKGRVGTTVEKMTDQGGGPPRRQKQGIRSELELPGKTSPGDRVFRTHDKLPWKRPAPA